MESFRIKCDYDIQVSVVKGGRYFDDETFVYGFFDRQPRVHVKNGGTYGISYRTYLLVGIGNLFVVVMMITSDQAAFSSIRNTVSCMRMGQATRTAAALCAQRNCVTRDLSYKVL